MLARVVPLLAMLILAVPQASGAAAQASREAPILLGQPAAVGNYEITVLSVTPDARQIVTAENQFNEPPAEGRQFYLARIGVRYTGTEPGTPWIDLSFRAVGNSGVGYTEFDNDCGVIPEDASSYSDIFQGAQIEFNVCWAIASADATSLVMYVEPSFSFDDEPTWFSLGNEPQVTVGTPVVTDAATTSSREAPIPLGSAGQVDDYIVTVVSTTPDAAAEIAAENQFNDPPAPGTQFFMTRVQITYVGTESGTPWLDLGFKAVGNSAIGYTEFDNDCGVIPESGTLLSDIFPGGTVEYNVCWAIDSGDAESLVMYVEPLFSFDSEPMWFALRP
jgi:hypothetical protein